MVSRKKIKSYNNFFQTDDGMPGGYSDTSVTDPTVVKAAEEAFAFYKKVTPRLDGFTIQEICKAEVQVVQGFNYRVKFRVEADGLSNLFSVICNAVVNIPPVSNNLQTLEVSCEPKLKE